MGDKFLEVKNLKTYFRIDEDTLKAVDGVSFIIEKGRTLGLVGESGCGKSVTALSMMKLIPSPPAVITGEVNLSGKNILAMGDRELRGIRGNKISMIFQEPMTSLNPVFTVESQIVETIMLHQKTGKQEAVGIAIGLLKDVGIPEPGKRLKDYPHQLSGGMRQRIMIAMALSCNPGLLIADEPTTALDVTIQAQILELLKDLQTKFGMGILMITHDLGVISEIAHDVCVMYTGKVVEQAGVNDLFESPLHPYTLGLMSSIPSVDKKNRKLDTIPGTVPDLLSLPTGCNFSTRCYKVKDKCLKEKPELVKVGNNHFVSCWFPEKGR